MGIKTLLSITGCLICFIAGMLLGRHASPPASGTRNHAQIEEYTAKQTSFLQKHGAKHVSMRPTFSPAGDAIILRGRVGNSDEYELLQMIVGNPFFNPDVPAPIVWNVAVDEDGNAIKPNLGTNNYSRINAYIKTKQPFLQTVGAKHIRMDAAPSAKGGMIILSGHVMNLDEYKFLQLLLHNKSLNPDAPSTIVWYVSIGTLGELETPTNGPGSRQRD